MPSQLENIDVKNDETADSGHFHLYTSDILQPIGVDLETETVAANIKFYSYLQFISIQF